MNKMPRIFEAIWRRHSDWIDARISRAIETYVEQVEKNANNRVLELSHRIETRVTLASLEFAQSIKELREQTANASLESARLLSQIRENIERAVLESQISIAELRGQAIYEAESRAQMAGCEAKAYSDAGLYSISRSMAAANRVVTESSQRLKSLDRLHSRTAEELAQIVLRMNINIEVQNEVQGANTKSAQIPENK